MNSVLTVAAALPLVLGAALVATSVADRKRAALRQRISHNLSVYTGIADSDQSLRLDTGGPETANPALRWLPAGLGPRIEAALAATGDRVTSTHLVFLGSLGGLIAYLLTRTLAGLNPLLVLPVMLATALALPIFFVRFKQARFQASFLSSFPDALDLIVRAVRAGLPVSDALETVGTEIIGPVGAEFRRIHQGVTIGLDLEQELQRAAKRIRLIEFQFFIVALALQRRTGGNLAETLDNLATTIRRRKEMWMKARALMSESRASAWLIGILPFVGATAIYFINASYIGMLVYDPRGKIMLFTAIVLLLSGAYIMRTMIKRSMR